MKRLNPYSGLVGGLSAGELELLSAAVEERRLREEIGVGTLAEAADRYRPRPACPACGEASPWRDGREPSGVRRWRCPSCGARFASLTGTVLENCKKPLSTWVSFIRLALFAVPLDACAEACRTTHQTAWEWRHRLFAADGAAQSGLSAPLACRRTCGRDGGNLLKGPYEVKFTKRDAREKVLLVPNTSHAFARLMAAAISRQGVRAEALEVGREEAIELGKRYVHNDICFPAQITIGEALYALKSGKYDDKDVAMITGKYIGDCRLTHYMPLLRKALDDAGYPNVPVLTNDDADAHNAYPGFRLDMATSIQIAWGLPMIDALEALLRRMRPYELEPGSADRAFEAAVDELMAGLEKRGIAGLERGFARAIDIMKGVRYDRSRLRPTVLIVGEYLLNFHPGANHEIERYLEQNGLEIIEARMTDVIRKSYFYKHAQSREYHVGLPFGERSWYAIADHFFELAHDRCDRIARAHPLYEPPTRMPELVKQSDEVLHHTFDAGEGVLIPAEILEQAKHGCRAFVILQPFGCLPSHVVGRGLVRALKNRYPDAQFLPLDYDPDVSFANVENRLQMLIMGAKERGNAEPGEGAAEQARGASEEGSPHGTTA